MQAKFGSEFHYELSRCAMNPQAVPSSLSVTNCGRIPTTTSMLRSTIGVSWKSYWRVSLVEAQQALQQTAGHLGFHGFIGPAAPAAAECCGYVLNAEVPCQQLFGRWR